MESVTSLLGRELGTCFQLMWRRIRQTLEPFGLTGPQFGILKNLKHHGPLTPTELSTHLLVTPGNVTGLVRRLIKLKLIEQRRLVKDRRCSRIALTALGEKKLQEIQPTILAEFKEFFRDFPAVEKQTFLELLKKLSRAVNPDGIAHPCSGGQE